MILSVGLVCRVAHEWTLPVLYHSVVLRTALQITQFYATHNSLDNLLMDRLLLVHNLWFGNTHNPVAGDLSYGSTSWPITVIHRILWSCTNLRSLVIVNLDQNAWHRLENVIPGSLEKLAMGPIHGPFHINNLKQRPHLRSFTSIMSYMRDDEVRDVVLYPHIRQFRRIVDSDRMSVALNRPPPIVQLGWVAESDTLQKMEIIVCGPPTLFGTWGTEIDDKRIVIRLYRDTDWVHLLRDEFIADSIL